MVNILNIIQDVGSFCTCTLIGKSWVKVVGRTHLLSITSLLRKSSQLVRQVRIECTMPYLVCTQLVHVLFPMHTGSLYLIHSVLAHHFSLHARLVEEQNICIRSAFIEGAIGVSWC